MAFNGDLSGRNNGFRWFDSIGRARWRLGERRAMRDRATVLTPTKVSDGAVGSVTSYAEDATRANVPCRYSPITANESEVSAEIIAQSTCVVVFDAEFTVRAFEQLDVTVEGRTRRLAIIGVNDLEGRAWSRKAYCTDDLSKTRGRS